ncbi:MAG: YaiI/YqxD family protein [Chloroflexota bacterium]
MRILVDADACPVKEQIYKVAARYSLPVLVVANSLMRVPEQAGIEFVHVPGGLDIADDWIAEAATMGDIVTTADLPLAGRVVDKGAICIDFRGKEFTPDSLGGMLASREIASYLRGFGAYTSGPPPLNPRDRGKFAGKLDEVVNRQLRVQRSNGFR